MYNVIFLFMVVGYPHQLLTNPELIGIMSLVNTLDTTQAVIVDGITQYSNALTLMVLQ